MRMLMLALLLPAFCGFGSAQNERTGSTEMMTMELYSPWIFDGSKPRTDPNRARRSCLNLVALDQTECMSTNAVRYGNRFGDNWDIFAVEVGDKAQTRMLDLGIHDWKDNVEVPYVRPWARLRPGEKRHISINTSGTRAPDGKTYAQTSVDKQVSTTVVTVPGEQVEDNYAPYLPVVKGHMYVVRVLIGEIDYYLLLRVDEVETGDKISISFKKVAAPKASNF